MMFFAVANLLGKLVTWPLLCELWRPACSLHQTAPSPDLSCQAAFDSQATGNPGAWNRQPGAHFSPEQEACGQVGVGKGCHLFYTIREQKHGTVERSKSHLELRSIGESGPESKRELCKGLGISIQKRKLWPPTLYSLILFHLSTHLTFLAQINYTGHKYSMHRNNQPIGKGLRLTWLPWRSLSGMPDKVSLPWLQTMSAWCLSHLSSICRVGLKRTGRC